MSSPPDSPLDSPAESSPSKPTARRPFHFLLRGLAITLPPVLTIIILLWIGSVIDTYILTPTSKAMRYAIARGTDQSRPISEFQDPEPWMPSLDDRGRKYVVTRDAGTKLQLQKKLQTIRSKAKEEKTPKDELDQQLVAVLKPRAWVALDGRAVPFDDYSEVAHIKRTHEMPMTANGIYMELARTRHFAVLVQLSAIAVVLAVVLLYFIGRLVTVRVGAWMVQKFESGVMGRVPLVSQVYSSVKQLTDFFFTERTVEYNRVVALEYPRRGIWSIGFVTSDSLLEIAVAAGEPLLTVLMPTSPMPMTGFTVNIPRSEVIDLNITIEQAFQYCISCGVLVPPQQKVTPESLQNALTKRLTAAGLVNADGAGGLQRDEETVRTEGTQAGTPS